MTFNVITDALYKEVADVELLRPIHSDEQYQRTIDAIEELVLKPDPADEELEYLDALTVFVERYEEKRYPLGQEPISVLDLLKTLMGDKMNGSALGKLLGNRSLGGAILRGERELSKSHIKILSEHFSVSTDLFLPNNSLPTSRIKPLHGRAISTSTC